MNQYRVETTAGTPIHVTSGTPQMVGDHWYFKDDSGSVCLIVAAGCVITIERVGQTIKAAA